MKVKTRPPRDGLVRARPQALELRKSSNGAMPTLSGHFAMFNEWARIDSLFEGTFMERIAPGAFKKTFSENRDEIKVLFQHGYDPQVGDKPLGRLTDLREDDVGAYYEAPLLDTSYNRDLLPGLEEGLYGASFKFRVIREEIDEEPGISDHNPDGLPERTIKEAQVYEGGPVTFPAYAGATAGVRSMTDEMLVERMAVHPTRMRQLIDFAEEQVGDNTDNDETRAAEEHSDEPGEEPEALSEGAEASHSDNESRDATPTKARPWSLETHGKEWRLP